MIKKSLLILLSASILFTSVPFMVACKNPNSSNNTRQKPCPKGKGSSCTCY